MRNVFHDGVRWRFDVDGRGGEGGDVFGESDITHEAGEPIPHREAVELAEKRGVVEADPADGALLDGFGEGCGSGRRPVIRRIVELDEELIVREEGLIDGLCIFDVIDGEVISFRFLREPYFGGCDVGLMLTAVFGDCQDSEGG